MGAVSVHGIRFVSHSINLSHCGVRCKVLKTSFGVTYWKSIDDSCRYYGSGWIIKRKYYFDMSPIIHICAMLRYHLSNDITFNQKRGELSYTGVGNLLCTAYFDKASHMYYFRNLYPGRSIPDDVLQKRFSGLNIVSAIDNRTWVNDYMLYSDNHIKKLDLAMIRYEYADAIRALINSHYAYQHGILSILLPEIYTHIISLIVDIVGRDHQSRMIG